jgi:membrane protease YdiL (CAAX protease family)
MLGSTPLLFLLAAASPREAPAQPADVADAAIPVSVVIGQLEEPPIEARGAAEPTATADTETAPPAKETAPPAKEAEPSDKSPAIAAALATVLPGAGHLYLGEPLEAAGWAGAVVGTGALTATFALDGVAHGGSVTNPFSTASSLYFGAAWGTNVFDAWRDARIAQGATRVPKDTLADLAGAPFDLDVMTRWQTWAAIGGMLAVGVGGSLVGDVAFGRQPTFDLGIAKAKKVDFLGAALPPTTGFLAGNAFNLLTLPAVAVGEEAYFRGFLQTALSEITNDWIGLGLSTALFAAVHAPNALLLPPEQQAEYLAVSLPTITVLGAGLGLLYMSEDFSSLESNVAAHYWYDALVLGLAFAANPDGSFFFSSSGTF